MLLLGFSNQRVVISITSHFDNYHAQLLKMKNRGRPLGMIKLGRQNGRLLHWPKCSRLSKKTKLWKLLLRPAVCVPSLIVQWPATNVRATDQQLRCGSVLARIFKHYCTSTSWRLVLNL